MNEIKERKQQTHVALKDWRTLISERSPKDIMDWLNTNSHIMIEWEIHSKRDIVSAKPIVVDDLESYIQSQTKDIQEKLRSKKKILKKDLWKDMSLAYAMNYVKNILENQYQSTI